MTILNHQVVGSISTGLTKSKGVTNVAPFDIRPIKRTLFTGKEILFHIGASTS